MTRRLMSAVLSATLVLSVSTPVSPQEPASAGVHWPSFRGVHARGIAEGFETPTRWNAETSENVRWKTPIPGLGHSSPIVWGDLVCVTSAISGQERPTLKVGLYGDITPVNDDTRHTWKVLCLDKQTGRVRWEQTAHQAVPTIKRHPKSTHANSTLATDGEHIVAFFGSEGLYCYDLDGNLLWKNDLGLLDSGYYVAPDAQWGFAASPIIWNGMVIVQCDVLTRAFIAAFSVEDGREIWRTTRDDVPTFSTPTIHESDLGAQLIVNGYRHLGGYDARTGEMLWRMAGSGDIPVPTPVVAHDLAFITHAHAGAAIYAIRLSAVGDISLTGDAQSNEYVVWSRNRDGGYMQTPIVYGDYLYVCRDNGVLSAYDARTGRRLYQQRLAGGRTGFSASPVAADGKVYFTSEEGDVFVIKAGAEFELLAENPMGEVAMATPAISEGVLFFRTQGHLVSIGEN